MHKQLTIRTVAVCIILSFSITLLACESPEPSTTNATAIPTIVPTVSSSPSPAFTSTPTETVIPTTPTAISISVNELSITVAEIPGDLPAYNRDDWRHWIDEDGDCQDTRQEVLVAESLVDISFQDDRTCRVVAGSWYAAFTGTTVTDPRELDIDHLVPLANAHRSGAWAWSPEKKRTFANSLDDPDHLIAVTAMANRSKGARGPDEWRPPDESYWCEYVMDWINIKQAWGLTATQAEANALGGMLASCNQPTELRTTISEVSGVASSPTPAPSLDLVYSSCEEAEAAGEERVRGTSGSGRGFPARKVPSARDGDGDGVVCES